MNTLEKLTLFSRVFNMPRRQLMKFSLQTVDPYTDEFFNPDVERVLVDRENGRLVFEAFPVERPHEFHFQHVRLFDDQSTMVAVQYLPYVGKVAIGNRLCLSYTLNVD